MNAILGNATYVGTELLESLPEFRTTSPSTCSLNVLGATILLTHYALLMLEYCCHDLFLILILVMICFFFILYTPADKAMAWCGTAVIP